MRKLKKRFHDYCWGVAGDWNAEGKPFDKLPWWKFYLLAVIAMVRDWTRLQVCNLRGHVWEERGYATPDTGAIVLHCTRCGEGFAHVLY